MGRGEEGWKMENGKEKYTKYTLLWSTEYSFLLILFILNFVFLRISIFIFIFSAPTREKRKKEKKRLNTSPLVKKSFWPVIHDPQSTSEPDRKEFGVLHPNNVGQGKGLPHGEDRWMYYSTVLCTVHRCND